MKQMQLRITLLIWVLAMGYAVPALAEQQDEDAIRQVQVLQAGAWQQQHARA